MDALRSEVSLLHNINVTNVLPGSVKTLPATLLPLTARFEACRMRISMMVTPMECAKAILNAVKNNVPELIFAKGMELELIEMRHKEPEKLFSLAEQLGAQLTRDGIPQ